MAEAMMSTVSWPKEWYIKRWWTTTPDISSIWTIKWVWGIQWIAWNKMWATQQQLSTNARKLQPIWRINQTNPKEDELLLWIAYDITWWRNVKEVIDKYPEVDVDKIGALWWYIYDAQDLKIDQKKLFDAYPELSETVKSRIRWQFKSAIETAEAKKDLETNPMSTKEKAWTLWLWIAQWVWDVWYKIIWEKINKLWATIWEKIKDTKTAKRIVDKTIGLLNLTEDDIKAYQESEQLRKQSDTPYSSEENANILRAIGWRRAEESVYWKTWKNIWQFAWQTALEMAAGWFASWATKRVLWSTAKTFIWKKLKSAAIWAAAWLWAAEATAASKEWRLATAKELKTGALLWWIWWAVFAWQITKTDKNVWDYLLKWLTKQEYQDRAKSMWLSTNAFWKIKNIFSEWEKKMIDATKWIINPKKTSIYNMNKLNKWISQVEDKLDDVISKYKYKININNIKWEFNKIVPPDSVKYDATMWKVYNSIKNKLIKMIEKTDRSPKSILAVRREFDKLVEKEIPSLRTTPASNPMKSAIMDLRRIPNEIVNKQIWDDVVKWMLEKQHEMYKAINLLATRAEKVWTTAISRRARKNKELLKAGWLLAAGAVGSRAISAAEPME